MIEDKINEYEQVINDLSAKINNRIQQLQRQDPNLQNLLGQLIGAQQGIKMLKDLLPKEDVQETISD